MDDNYRRSVEILLQYQDQSGAYLACPNFPTYRYAWLRDGSFCSLALDYAGQVESAGRFHHWVLGVLGRYQAKLKRCSQQALTGQVPPGRECLHSRFTVEGGEVPGKWGHHQLDGLGTWLWVYAQRALRTQTRPSPADCVTLELARDYLAALWRYPCSDCWEEHEDQVHVYTLGAVFAGLHALSLLLEDELAGQTAEEIRCFVLSKATSSGKLAKSIGNHAVDANLLALAVPYNLLSCTNPLYQATVNQIRADLEGPLGGLHRYAGDTYYGGGEWVLLSAWLGWAAAEMGDIALAQRQLEWVEAQFTPQGELPEQSLEHLNFPEYRAIWEDRWGPAATPLLWSHAQYLILWHKLHQPGVK